MLFSIDRTHRDFFFKNHFVEFEGLLKKEEVSCLLNEIYFCLSKRLDKPVEEISEKEAFFAGHNLYTCSPALRKIILRRNFAQIASSLIGISPLRIAFDQFFFLSKSSKLDESRHPYIPLTPLTFSESSSVQPVVCGLMINLRNHEKIIHPKISEEEDSQTPSTIPSYPGNGSFFNTTSPVILQSIVESSAQDLLFIIYGKEKMQYVKNALDPHVHQLKKLGYVFGDQLQITTHPLLYR